MTTTDRKWNNFEPVAYLEQQTPMACPVYSPSLKYNTHVVHCLIVLGGEGPPETWHAATFFLSESMQHSRLNLKRAHTGGMLLRVTRPATGMAPGASTQRTRHQMPLLQTSHDVVTNTMGGKWQLIKHAFQVMNGCIACLTGPLRTRLRVLLHLN